jgi:DHA3 family tetracycline resistance protein-like MFS transporter
VIAAIANLLGLATPTLARRVSLDDPKRLAWLLGALLVGMAAGVVVIALAAGFIAVLVAYWWVGALRSAYGPLLSAWLNRLLPEHGKATLFSIYGQADALGQIGGGPVVGLVAKTVSIGAALVGSALLLTPSVALYRRLARRGVEVA